MDNSNSKEFIEKIREKLKAKKKAIEEQLLTFAKEDEKLKGKWKTTFPKFNGGEAGSSLLEKASDEVEEFSTLLSLGATLENQLKEIDLALKKIEKGKFGICEKCKRPISKERLEICPEARLCEKCLKK